MVDPVLIPHERRGASIHLRVGSGFAVSAHLDVAPLRFLAIGALVAGILWSVPPIIRAAAERRRDRGLPGLAPDRNKG